MARWQVMSVTELMDENGDIINERVGLGDELVEINGVHVSTMVVGEVIHRVSGAVDTLVRMTFRNNRESREYSVTARRHVPINAPAGARPRRSSPCRIDTFEPLKPNCRERCGRGERTA